MAVDSSRIGGSTPVLVLALVLAVAAAVLAGVAAITYSAYNRQADKVEDVQAKNAKIEHEHTVIGSQFAEQSERLKQALAAMDRAYGRGFTVGRKAGTLPAPFVRLAQSVQQGYVVPLRIPPALRRNRPAVRRTPHGYTVRWGGVALFASDREALRDWTAKAWPNTRRRVRIGNRSVVRMVGVFGTVYAWRERNKTYGVLAKPRADSLVAPLVRSLG